MAREEGDAGAARHARGSLDRRFLELLACPLTKGPLHFDNARSELVSRSAKLAYPVRDGIPILLVAEARQISEDD